MTEEELMKRIEGEGGVIFSYEVKSTSATKNKINSFAGMDEGNMKLTNVQFPSDALSVEVRKDK